MEIALISPRSSNVITHHPFFISPLLGLYQLNSVTPSKFKVKIIDENTTKINFNKKYDIVGITCTTPTANRAYYISDQFRKKGSIVILGGWHPSVIPKEAKQHADSVVIGEAETIWPQILKDIKTKSIKPYYENNKFINPIEIPSAKRQSNYSFVAEIQSTRGCRYLCPYCVIPEKNIWHQNRFRPVGDVINEIKSIKQKILIFQDSSLTSNPSYSKSLFKEMIKLNKRFICDGNIFVLNKDEELLKLARKAGCISWFTGLELNSFRSNIVNNSIMSKEFIKAVKKIKDYGMSVTEFIWFGFDSDFKDIFKKTADLLSKSEIDVADFCIATPFPGTRMFFELEKQNRLLTRDWSKYNLRNVVFKPKNMTPSELIKGIEYIAKEFYSTKNVLNRLSKGLIKLNLFAYVGMAIGNLMSIKNIN